MRNNPHKTRSDEIDEMLAGLRQKMAWTPGWLKAEIDEVIRLEVEKATAERNAR